MQQLLQQQLQQPLQLRSSLQYGPQQRCCSSTQHSTERCFCICPEM
jgi:hypothetical protein